MTSQTHTNTLSNCFPIFYPSTFLPTGRCCCCCCFSVRICYLFPSGEALAGISLTAQTASRFVDAVFLRFSTSHGEWYKTVKLLGPQLNERRKKRDEVEENRLGFRRRSRCGSRHVALMLPTITPSGASLWLHCQGCTHHPLLG